MAWFEAETESKAVVAAPPEAIWAALSDPATVARLTPLVHAIEADGDLWRWQLARVPVLGLAVSPAFTEHMKFEEPHRIDYTHAPPPGHVEHAGVEGCYVLEKVDRGTHLAVAMTVGVELPLPRATGIVVRTAMRTVIATMGAGFSRNLLRHLDVKG